MFRVTAVKATNSGMMRPATCGRRSLASIARPAASSRFALAARRPLALADRLSHGKRFYAASAEGVVSIVLFIYLNI